VAADSLVELVPKTDVVSDVDTSMTLETNVVPCVEVITTSICDCFKPVSETSGYYIPNRAFNNFQFVNFTEIMSKSISSLRKEAAFALAALIDIPSQENLVYSGKNLIPYIILLSMWWTNVAHIEAIDGSFIGKKESGLVWQRQEGFGSYHYHYQAKELLDHLESVLANEPIVVKKEQHFVEVKPRWLSKNLRCIGYLGIK
ncbi:trehalose-6-phosphate synthase, partial [Trifolium pratense]